VQKTKIILTKFNQASTKAAKQYGSFTRKLSGESQITTNLAQETTIKRELPMNGKLGMKFLTPSIFLLKVR